MTKFNPENKATLTFGESLGPAMQITDAEDARQYLASYVKYTEERLKTSPNSDGKTAEQICKTNLGYYAGYGSDETRERVERLFNCSHPIFGSVAKNGHLTEEDAYQMGLKFGRELCVRMGIGK